VPANVTETKIHINQIGYFLRDGEETSLSAECEVNINCPEGDNWQDEKKGVVRLLIKNGNQIHWISIKLSKLRILCLQTIG
jgi:Ni,Fe-hydrogenase I large subunit